MALTMVLRTGERVELDWCDLDVTLEANWHASRNKDGRVYVAGTIKGKRIYLHRHIKKCPRGVEVDHENGNTLDNRRSNLRFATTSQNQANRRKKVNAHSSKFKGVTFIKDKSYKNKKWRAELVKDRQRVFCAYFVTEEEAARAYDLAASEHFGKFARLNFPGGNP